MSFISWYGTTDAEIKVPSIANPELPQVSIFKAKSGLEQLHMPHLQPGVPPDFCFLGSFNIVFSPSPFPCCVMNSEFQTVQLRQPHIKPVIIVLDLGLP